MKKVFLDANVLISVLNKEYPLFLYSSRVLSLANDKEFQLYTSSLCLAIAFYFSSKKSGEALAKTKIEELCKHLSIAVITENAVKESLADPRAHDLEDGFQYYAAIEAGCVSIVTENVSDYFFSEIEVLSSEQFLIQKVLVKRKGID
jgi:predicted nucleic acid-binding protein